VRSYKEHTAVRRLFPSDAFCSMFDAREHCMILQTCALPGNRKKVTSWIPHTIADNQRACTTVTTTSYLHISLLANSSDDEFIDSSGL
jgi:hypothetical protein